MPVVPKFLEGTFHYHWRQHLNPCQSWLPSSNPIHIESEGTNRRGAPMNLLDGPASITFACVPILKFQRSLQAWKEGQDTCWYIDRSPLLFFSFKAKFHFTVYYTGELPNLAVCQCMVRNDWYCLPLYLPTIVSSPLLVIYCKMKHYFMELLEPYRVPPKDGTKDRMKLVEKVNVNTLHKNVKNIIPVF